MVCKKKYKVIVVSSAMSGVTNELLLKTKKFLEIFQMMKKMLFYQPVSKFLVL